MEKTNIFVTSNRINTNFLYSFLHENNVKFMPIRCGVHGLDDFASEYLGVTCGDCNVFCIGLDNYDNEKLKDCTLEEDSFYKIGYDSVLIDEFLKKEEHDDYIVFESATHYEGSEFISVDDITAKKLLEICKTENKDCKTVEGIKNTTTSSQTLGVRRR